MKEWKAFSEEEKINWIHAVSEIKDGIGIPFIINGKTIYHPHELLECINDYFAKPDNDRFIESGDSLLIESIYEEQEVLIEEFIEGIEFSCIVIRNDSRNVFALPPTEIKTDCGVIDPFASFWLKLVVVPYPTPTTSPLT